MQYVKVYLIVRRENHDILITKVMTRCFKESTFFVVIQQFARLMTPAVANKLMHC